MGRPKKLKDLRQIDGKNHQVELKSLDAFFGYANCKYKTHDSKEYEDYLMGLDKIDLQREATNVGLMPTDDRRILKERLTNEFNRYQGTLNAASVKTIRIQPTKIMREILNEGANKFA